MSAQSERKPLRILYFGPRGLSGGIGGSARLRNMLDVLSKLGAQTHLITYLPAARFGISHEQINQQLKVTAVSVNRAIPKVLKFLALKLIFYYGLRYAGRSDVIFAHSPGVVYGFPALVMAKLFGRPLFIDLTDTRDYDTPGFLYRYILNRADLVFAVSRYLVEAAEKTGSRKVVHAPGFINTEMFRFDVAARERIRKELKISEQDIVIGYAGAISPDEGLTCVIEALEKLSPRHPNLKLVMLGGRHPPGSDDIPRLVSEKGLQEKVVLVPPQPYESVPGYLSAFDIGVSPKIDKELNRAADPIRVYEYMAVGLPVIASRVGETANAIEDGVDGFLFKPQDFEDLARVLEKVIQNLGSLRELREKAREKVKEHYSQEATLTRLKAHLPELISKDR